MFEWIPVYTTDVYIQREISGNNIQFRLTFIRKNELNGQLIIPEEAIAAIIELRDFVVGRPKVEISLDRILVHL